MDYRDIIQAMDDIGFPCRYSHYLSPPTPPYTTIGYRSSSDLMADNVNYKGVGNHQLELYHDVKHPPSEKKIEQKLKELRLPYYKVEAFLDSEKMYQVIYNIQLLGG